jgi:hypothetical protein
MVESVGTQTDQRPTTKRSRIAGTKGSSTMDFDLAAKRLQREHQSSSILQGGRRKAVQLSDRAVREAQVRKRQQERRAQERAAQVLQQEKLDAYMRQCERT